MTLVQKAIANLLRFDSCTISDALDNLGLPGAVHGLPPQTLIGKRVAGRAVTVKLGPPIEGLPKRHLGAGAVMAAETGDIIVVENRGRTDVSGWGGLLSRGALRKGVSAVVVDGAFRDIDEARELGLPIFARNAVPITARGRIAEHDFNCPVTIAGIAVQPGDWLLADGSGVVFVPAIRLDAVIEVAETILAKEQLMARDIEAGIPIGDVMGADYEDMLKMIGKNND
ncbi:RraA family protein [Novosphingobium sp. Leaf2]|uniref:RraA family protein n=1 Tax=Novosphingobium sp. Leaf2 TaxID=1735670 RepID=UPI0006F4B538|nr:dimethylmenaquinone methyltransferase [Novosphingobium sp. Leaf2]KQM19848.1 dimethylmenaquinone methyltransferase [Novosphingobium sp. Leaf2]